MPVRWITSGAQAANSFVYGNILIDAGVPPMALEAYKDRIETIILTHCHYDHTAYAAEIARLCNATLCIHELDAPGLLEDARSLAMLFGARTKGIVPDRTLTNGEMVGSLEVIHTPGHTPGCISLYDREKRILFSGDTVFTGGSFGRYDFPGGDRIALAASLERLAALPVDALYPGHGEPVTSGGERHIAAARELMKTYG
ncbi:beta-lactamase [Methanoculleus taiwanensis]|uniref:Beta-lactamase n=1 Tax=Methanoculleus taiwanensis TaxID=1550565 RepID=A0A498H288_9EURY|nr:MBL fold metallo-hydrolase [Methanoculleus taiwanensis]RXE56853.1 beta-lactamase [Methanoculleus taiwanensis]